MKIDYEDYILWREEGGIYRNLNLNELELYRDGKKLDIPKEFIERFNFTGLCSIHFFDSYNFDNEDTEENLTKEEMLKQIGD